MATSLVIGVCLNQERNYAKRSKRGVRVKKEPKVVVEKKRPWEVTKVDPKIIKQTRAEILNTFKPPPVDDVWLISEHRPPLYNFEDIWNIHRQTHQPSVYNDSNAQIFASFLLDMSMGETKSKPMDSFQGIINFPNRFDKGPPKRILAVVSDEADQEAALKNGAERVAGFNVVKLFKDEEIFHTDFDHIVVHEDMISEMVDIRRYLKHHFPSKKRGNIGVNMGELVHTFFHGLEYKSEKDMFEIRYAQADVFFGRLSMEGKAVEENLKLAIEQIESHRPKNVQNPFILSVSIWSPPSPEKLCIPYWQYLTEIYEPKERLESYTTRKYIEKSFIM